MNQQDEQIIGQQTIFCRTLHVDLELTMAQWFQEYAPIWAVNLKPAVLFELSINSYFYFSRSCSYGELFYSFFHIIDKIDNFTFAVHLFDEIEMLYRAKMQATGKLRDPCDR